MLKQYLPRRSLVVWLVGLLLLSLVLAACSGSTGSVSEEPAATTETEEVASPAKEEEAAEAPEATATEAVAVSEETETAPQESLLTPTATEVTCQSVAIPDNGLIAAVSDSDWTKGPANAPVTLIEYGDFQ